MGEPGMFRLNPKLHPVNGAIFLFYEIVQC